MKAFFIADITNYARVPRMRLTLYESSGGQKLDESVVDGEPNPDLYQLTRFLIGTEPLFIALDGALQVWCHQLVPVPKTESKAIRSTLLSQLE